MGRGVAAGLIPLGRVVKAHGLTGELKVNAYSGDPASFQGLHSLYVDQGEEEKLIQTEILRWRPQERIALLVLNCCQNRDQAEALKGAELLVQRGQLPDLAEDEYYFHDMKGLTVQSEDGVVLGAVEAVFDNGATGVLSVRGQGGCEYLIPYVDEYVLDEDAERLVMRLPPGLLEIND